MTDINHRRKNRKPVNQRHLAANGEDHHYHNGFPSPGNKGYNPDVVKTHSVGSTDFLYKGFNGGASAKSTLADKSFSAHVETEFSNGKRGQAKAVRGAKKYVTSRIRFHEKAATRKLATADDE